MLATLVTLAAPLEVLPESVAYEFSAPGLEPVPVQAVGQSLAVQALATSGAQALVQGLLSDSDLVAAEAARLLTPEGEK